MRLSVLLCLYSLDNPQRFDAVLSSIDGQTQQADEIVIVCDGPITAELEAIIEKHRTEKYVVVKKEKNEGRGKARNTGLEYCRGEYIAICDADDINISTRFEKQLERLDADSALSVIGGFICERDADGSERLRVVPQTDDEIRALLKKRCPFNNMTAIIKKSAIVKAGGYMDINSGEDYILWAALLKNGEKTANIPEVLCFTQADSGFYERRGGKAYFGREKRMMKEIYKLGMMSYPRYMLNIAERFLVQCCMTRAMRRWFYRGFIRNK